MKSIFLTGGSGFVGSNMVDFFGSTYAISKFKREDSIDINQDIVIHLAGKAHDLKNITNANEYYQVNTELTKRIFNAFLLSDAKVFIFLSSVKAVADEFEGVLTEDIHPNPITHYGKSKLLAEQYILSRTIPVNKRVYILRPCMIHGPGNKGNLNLLYKIVSKGIPWPLGAFNNNRSFCSIDNLLFVIKELIDQEATPSGIYNVADDVPISTNYLISLLAQSIKKKPIIWRIPPIFIKKLANIGNLFSLPLNTERLEKLTNSFVVSNHKIIFALGKKLPISSEQGLLRTFKSLN